MKDSNFLALVDDFHRVINKMQILEKKSKTFSGGLVLHMSEVHTVYEIGRNKSLNVTELARIMAISKGAVSQMVNKLEKKEVIGRFKKPSNEKEVYFRLTKKGKSVYTEHEKFHVKMYQDLLDSLDGKDSRKFKEFIKIMDILECNLDKYINT